VDPRASLGNVEKILDPSGTRTPTPQSSEEGNKPSLFIFFNIVQNIYLKKSTKVYRVSLEDPKLSSANGTVTSEVCVSIVLLLHIVGS
jgi:hypothetical protein